MGKTWKKRNGHGKGVGNWRGKGEEYGHNWRPNSYRNSYREYTETDDDYPAMRRGSVPPDPWEDKQCSGRIRPDNSRFNHRSMRKAKEQRRNFEDNNHRSMRKAKEQRRNFEDNFPDTNIVFLT